MHRTDPCSPTTDLLKLRSTEKGIKAGRVRIACCQGGTGGLAPAAARYIVSRAFFPEKLCFLKQLTPRDCEQGISEGLDFPSLTPMEAPRTHQVRTVPEASSGSSQNELQTSPCLRHHSDCLQEVTTGCGNFKGEAKAKGVFSNQVHY